MAGNDYFSRKETTREEVAKKLVEKDTELEKSPTYRLRSYLRQYGGEIPNAMRKLDITKEDLEAEYAG